MIKIPGTREGWPAIERCLREGININITLLFSVEHYRAVAEAYLRALEALRGRVAIANARCVYAAFLEITRGARWKALEARGAKVQRPLWASTATKNAAYSDVLYVESLIGPSTITTVPPDTLRLFEDHGVVERTLPGDVVSAQQTMSALEAGGIEFADVNLTLEEEGIAKFARSLDQLLGVIGEKRRALAGKARAADERRANEPGALE